MSTMVGLAAKGIPTTIWIGAGEHLSGYLDLVNEKIGPPPLPASIPSAEDTFQAMVFDDLWAEADLQAVCHYLRGGTGLVIPPWPLLPRRL